MTHQVVVFDYGSGNLRSAVRMLERVGARVTLTAETSLAREADALYLPGVGAFHACVAGLRAAGGDEVVAERVARGRPVLGVCVGFQALFEGSDEPTSIAPAPAGLGLLCGTVQRLRAPVVPHMGWSVVDAASGSRLLGGLDGQRFYFVHSYAMPEGFARDRSVVVSTATHGARFAAAVEDGVLAGTQFHPEKSGDAGAALIENWLSRL